MAYGQNDKRPDVSVRSLAEAMRQGEYGGAGGCKGLSERMKQGSSKHGDSPKGLPQRMRQGSGKGKK